MGLNLKTLTPLWTGVVETGKMDYIHETGIIGSLRWWYEAIVRGLGGNICNPTSEGRSADRCPRHDGSYCNVCQVFGATGQRRKFRLRLGDGKPLFNDNARNILIPSGRIHQSRGTSRAGGWYLMGNSVIGDKIPLRFIPLASLDVSSHIRLVISLIDRHSAIGAKVSNGYGVVHVCENGQRVQVQALDNLPSRSQPPRQYILPDIRDFFFAKLQFQTPTNDYNWWQNIKGLAEAWNGQVTDSRQTVNVYNPVSILNRQQRDQARTHLQNVVENGLLATAPAVRNWLRYQWTSGLNDCQKYFLFGEARSVCPYCCQTGYREDKNNRQRNWCPSCKRNFAKDEELPDAASKINVSHAYRLDNQHWEFRVWGWIPCQSPDNISLNRDQFLRDLQTTLMDVATWQWVFNGRSPTPHLVEWHCLDCDQRDGLSYLKKLLGMNEGGAT